MVQGMTEKLIPVGDQDEYFRKLVLVNRSL